MPKAHMYGYGIRITFPLQGTLCWTIVKFYLWVALLSLNPMLSCLDEGSWATGLVKHVGTDYWTDNWSRERLKKGLSFQNLRASMPTLSTSAAVTSSSGVSRSTISLGKTSSTASRSVGQLSFCFFWKKAPLPRGCCKREDMSKGLT